MKDVGIINHAWPWLKQKWVSCDFRGCIELVSYMKLIYKYIVYYYTVKSLYNGMWVGWQTYEDHSKDFIYEKSRIKVEIFISSFQTHP